MGIRRLRAQIVLLPDGGLDMIRSIFDQCPLSPEDLAFLQKIFDQLCDEGCQDRKSPEAEDIASVLIELFQRGLKDKVNLMAETARRLEPPKRQRA